MWCLAAGVISNSKDSPAELIIEQQMPLSLPPPPPHGGAGAQLLDGATAAINDGTFTELVMQVTDASSATSEATHYVGATSEATQYVGATSGEPTQYVGATSGEVTQYVGATSGEVMAGEQSYEVYDANSGLYRVSLVVDCVA